MNIVNVRFEAFKTKTLLLLPESKTSLAAVQLSSCFSGNVKTRHFFWISFILFKLFPT